MKPYSQFKIPKKRHEFFKLIRKADGKRVDLKPLCTAREYSYLVRESTKFYCHSHGYWLESYDVCNGENKYYAPFHKMLLYFQLKFGEDYLLMKKKDCDGENGKFWFPKQPLTLGYFDDRCFLKDSSSKYKLYDLQYLLPQFIKKPLQEWINLGEFKCELGHMELKPTKEQKVQLEAADFVEKYNDKGLRLAKAFKQYYWNRLEICYSPVKAHFHSGEMVKVKV